MTSALLVLASVVSLATPPALADQPQSAPPAATTAASDLSPGKLSVSLELLAGVGGGALGAVAGVVAGVIVAFPIAAAAGGGNGTGFAILAAAMGIGSGVGYAAGSTLGSLLTFEHFERWRPGRVWPFAAGLAVEALGLGVGMLIAGPGRSEDIGWPVGIGLMALLPPIVELTIAHHSTPVRPSEASHDGVAIALGPTGIVGRF